MHVQASALFAAGISTVIRYYSHDTTRPAKRLSLPEAAALTAADLRLAIVHEGRFGDQAANFDRASGVADALYAQSYGADGFACNRCSTCDTAAHRSTDHSHHGLCDRTPRA